MAKGTRITLTKSESESTTGLRLIDIITTMIHDGQLEFREVEELHAFLSSNKSTIAAIHFLRALTREVIADGEIDDSEAYRLKLAFERVVPKNIRGIISTHLEDIGLPVASEEVAPEWTLDPATSRQIAYIYALGGSVTPEMTKGDASQLIEELLEHRPPTPRQVMLLRFFDRLDLVHATKDDVSEWIDELYSSDSRYERAWNRFKQLMDHDPHGQDPNVVPVGAFRTYTNARGHRPSIMSRAVAWLLAWSRANKNR